MKKLIGPLRIAKEAKIEILPIVKKAANFCGEITIKAIYGMEIAIKISPMRKSIVKYFQFVRKLDDSCVFCEKFMIFVVTFERYSEKICGFEGGRRCFSSEVGIGGEEAL